MLFRSLLANEKRTLDDEVKAFVEGLVHGENLWKGDARLTLREWFVAQSSNDRGRHGSLTTEEIFAAFVRAWNAFASGKELLVIRKVNDSSPKALPIFGYDKTRFADVPNIDEKMADIRRSNLPSPQPKKLDIVTAEAVA